MVREPRRGCETVRSLWTTTGLPRSPTGMTKMIAELEKLHIASVSMHERLAIGGQLEWHQDISNLILRAKATRFEGLLIYHFVTLKKPSRLQSAIRKEEAKVTAEVKRLMHPSIKRLMMMVFELEPLE